MSGALLVTTSHSLLRLDIDSREAIPIHRGDGLYFGIARHPGGWYVAARGRMVSSEVPPELESGRILVFDSDLAVTDRLAAPFALRDMHEILLHEGKLWITCSFDNMVATFEPRTGRWDTWYPLGPTPSPPYDVNHFNSLAIVDGRLAIVAHNFGASELLEFDIRTRELTRRTPFGIQAHNIRMLQEGVPMTCSSAEGALVAQNGWRLEVGGFPRGIARAGGQTYVGISEIAERKDRDLSEGRIAVFDPAWQHVHTISLPGEGLVLDIQPMP